VGVRTATPGNRYRQIVALEKVAGSIPVGHPPKLLQKQENRELWAASAFLSSPPPPSSRGAPVVAERTSSKTADVRFFRN
jgi:hypothetical protein